MQTDPRVAKSPAWSWKVRIQPVAAEASLPSADRSPKAFVVAAVRRAGLSCISLILALGAPAIAAGHVGSADQSAALPTLTTAFAVHNLTREQAARAYPVHLRAVVTYFNSFTDPVQNATFVHDATGSVYVHTPHEVTAGLAPGTLLDIRGVTDPANFAPIVKHPKYVILGRAPLPPPAPLATLAQLHSGSFDGHWVRAEGVVHAVMDLGPTLVIMLAMADGLESVSMIKEAGFDYQSLVDATIRVQGNVAPLFNGNGQLIGSRICSPGLQTIEVRARAVGDPFGRAVKTIRSLAQYTPEHDSPYRIHLRGTVTLQWPGSTLCIRDATHGICAQTLQTNPVAPGQTVDLIGFPAIGEDSPILTDATFRIEPGSSDADAQTLAPDAPSWIRHDADLVDVDGQLIRVENSANKTTLLIDTGGFILPALLPARAKLTRRWQEGSRVRVTGVCAVRLDQLGAARNGGNPVIESVRLLLRSADDVAVIRKASWWTPSHDALLLACGLVVTLAVLGWVVVLRKRVRESEERFRHMAQHDALTGLPSRSLLHDRLRMALARSERYGTTLAVLMLDIDHFKTINDTYGHPAGDQTLLVTAQRLSEAVRKCDTVARMGGDEFVVLLTEVASQAEAEKVAAKVVSALSNPIQAGSLLLPVSASVGLCVVSGSLDAEAMLKQADTALYQAKAQGRNCFELYTAEMAEEHKAKKDLKASLSRALERKELTVHYQPLIDFRTGRLRGFEALLRWRSQLHGWVPPTDFIALAEESGLIVQLGEWVLRTACQEIGLVERTCGQSFTLAVNLSPRQLEQPGLPSLIERILAESGRPPHLAEFEVTESMLMTDSALTHTTLMSLRKLGVRIAIDDFGVGFSSLSYITRFAIDSLKIDRSFIQACMHDLNSLTVVRAIIAMAHGLGIHVVAEGVETAGQFDFLMREGCDTAQGFFLGKPCAASALPAVVASFAQADDAFPYRVTREEELSPMPGAALAAVAARSTHLAGVASAGS